MSKVFKHPLARRATMAKLRLRDGGEQQILVVVTTLALDAAAKDYNAKNVERLRDAAQTFVKETEPLAGYSLVNRAKDWEH
jgi:inorganic pyrophosphatase